MSTEIERKFLIDPDLFKTCVASCSPTTQSQIIQGYLSRKPAVRVRHTSTGPSHSHPQGFITVKGSGNIVRSEWEYTIPAAEALEMMSLCDCALRKVRYTLPIWNLGPYHNLKWEVDEFLGNLEGLWVAEIELPDPNAEFPLPVWLGKEVSEDPRYSNAALALAQTIPTP